MPTAISKAAGAVAVHGATDALRLAASAGWSVDVVDAIRALSTPAGARTLLALVLSSSAPGSTVAPSYSGNGAIVAMPGRRPVTIIARDLVGRVQDAILDTPERFHRRCVFA